MFSRHHLRKWLLAAILSLIGCRAGPNPTTEPKPLSSLTSSLDPLKNYFNAKRGQHRFIAILSPTCPHNLRGARVINQALVQNTDTKPWAIAIIWIPMRPADDEQAAQRASRTLTNPRVRHFYDTSLLAGKAFGQATWPQFGKPAWGVYLFYDTKAQWNGPVPPPPAAKLGQFRGPRGQPLIAAEVDALNHPVALGPIGKLEQLLSATVQRLETQWR